MKNQSKVKNKHAGDITIEVCEHVDQSGNVLYYERLAAQVPLSVFEYGNQYKIACEACEKHGRNLACPPHSPSFIEYISDAATAKVLCMRLPMEYFVNPIPEERYRDCFQQARKLLIAELLDYRKKEFIVAGAGFCDACKQCAAETDQQTCIKPEQRIYSLESLGVNISGLAKTALDLDLEWSGRESAADFICALGAVFFKKN